MTTDLNPDGPPPEAPFDISKIVPRERILQPGVYFDLPEEQYHGSFGLSYSGIKHLRISPYDWWVRSPLNPNLEDVIKEEASDAKALGQAFDARIICGRPYFLAHYAPVLEPEKGALVTMDDMRGWLEDRGLPKTGRTKADLINRILAADPTAPIWEAQLQGYLAAHKGKEFLPFDLIAKIEMAAAMIEGHPDLNKALSGGAPQVSVVWDCPETGVRCRARFDYLKPKVIVDLKTLMPRDDQPLEQSIGREIDYRKYYIQAAYYLEAAAQIPAFLKAGQFSGNPPHPALVDLLIKNPAKEWLWIFQLKGVAPVAKGRLLRKESHVLQLGQIECDNAKHLFRACLDKYGAEPWVAPEPIKAIDEADIPAWSLL